jgi:diacylglycerol kinase (ATP)
MTAPDHDPKPARPTWAILHVVNATRYSLAGFRRLLQERAARIEIWGGAVIVAALLWRGVELWHWLIIGALFAVVLAAEALNTAIEILVDRISPEWSQMAKEAKDLGSFAVGILLLVTLVFAGLVLFGVV